jgi:hypothetical protein
LDLTDTADFGLGPISGGFPNFCFAKLLISLNFDSSDNDFVAGGALTDGVAIGVLSTLYFEFD